MSRTKLMHVPEIEAYRRREIEASADAAKPPRKWWSIAAWLDSHVAIAVHAHGVKVLTDVLGGHNAAGERIGGQEKNHE